MSPLSEIKHSSIHYSRHSNRGFCTLARFLKQTYIRINTRAHNTHRNSCRNTLKPNSASAIRENSVVRVVRGNSDFINSLLVFSVGLSGALFVSIRTVCRNVRTGILCHCISFVVLCSVPISLSDKGEKKKEEKNKNKKRIKQH